MFLEETTATAVSSAEATRLAAELYGIAATAISLPGEYDSNFYLRAADGQEFVLKCMHPARETPFIEMQCQALAHLAECAPQLPVPRIIANKHGEHFRVVADAAGQSRLVWLLSYLPGTTLERTNPHSH